MPMAINKIESEALNLDMHSRATLAGKLLLSLDEPSPSEVERLWLDEAQRRLDDYRSGKVQALPGNVVFAKAIGQTGEARLLHITFTIRNSRIRVISARNMHRKERIIYEQET